MYNGLLHLHNILRWVILILLIVMIIRHITGNNKNQLISPSDKKFGLFLMIAADITLLIGLYQWFTGAFGMKAISEHGMAEVMRDGQLRFFAVEHMIGMLLGIFSIHLGYNRSKKVGSNLHRSATVWYVVALVIIFLSIPWPFRGDAGRALFPGGN
jgi:uncharacterized membrane protein